MSPYARADGTMKTWQEVAENLQREVESERSRGEHADLLVDQIYGILESARARARQDDHGKEDRAMTITVLHGMMDTAVRVIEDQDDTDDVQEHDAEDDAKDDAEDDDEDREYNRYATEPFVAEEDDGQYGEESDVDAEIVIRLCVGDRVLYWAPHAGVAAYHNRPGVITRISGDTYFVQLDPNGIDDEMLGFGCPRRFFRALV